MAVSRRGAVYRNPGTRRTVECAWSPPAGRNEAMLTREENEVLTKTGPGTAMGALLRCYWIPVVQSAEVEAGGRVKRVRLLGEPLIVFRGKSGRAGLIGEFCPHRGASLYFGRVEDAGMSCIYHGWKFATAAVSPCPTSRPSRASPPRCATS